MTTTAALVRTPDGAILGIDWRREQGLVPGRVAAQNVMPGDTLVAQGTRVVVHRIGKYNGNAIIQAKSAGGADFAIARPLEQLVRVVEVGAFDRD
ncbi:hypothetical protein [Microbacterium sp. 2FI]|uniref:hypothetical protein n=1 Tax=Microbacterium sp. 2FI TaxID=2502193 RepID=UPI0010F6A168|nr:hypothetical protein [Microbacterium sp. 2FI]